MKRNWLPRINSSVCRTLSTNESHANPKYVNTAQSGKENFEKDFSRSHVETSFFQKVLLGLGSGIISITAPQRGDMIAVMGEVTGSRAFEYIHSKMMQSPEGRKILKDKPRISSGAVDLEKLKSYSEGTLGKAYSNFLEGYGYTPDTRNAVKFVDDFELAYVAQRYREVHDLFHTLLGMPTNMLGEVTVKWVEAIQLKLPMCAAGALFGSVRLAPKLTRAYSTKVTVKLDEELEKKVMEEEVNPKSHPGVMHVKCTGLPEPINENINNILTGHNQPELLKKSKVLVNFLTSRHVPPEEDVIASRKKEFHDKAKKLWPKIDDEKLLEKKIANKLKRMTYNWKPADYDENKSLVYLVGRAPAEYAVLRRVFNEIVMRDKNFTPQSLFDFGSGVGTVTWAAHELWGNSIQEYFCVDSSKSMNDLAELILKGTNTKKEEPLIKNVYYRQFLPLTPKPYDIVVSSFSFFEISSFMQRMKILTVLWNNTAKYLVLIENGTNSGFQLITEARDYVLSASQNKGISGYVFAPCPHELRCPRLEEDGKKTPCNFQMKFTHLNMANRKNENSAQRFCYVILKKGKRPPEDRDQMRIVRELMLRRKHVVCKFCTSEGRIENVTLTASKQGKAIYNCVKQSHWGDLIPGKLIRLESDSGTDSEELISDSDSDSDEDVKENEEKK